MSDIFSVYVDFSEIEKVINNGLKESTFNNAQKYFAKEVHRWSDDYVPFSEGALKNLSYVAEDGSYIEYTQPYARYMWYGKLMVDPKTGKGCFYNPVTGRMWSRKGVQKVLTDRDLQYNGAPKRGPKWVERMWNENSQTICNEVQNFIVQEITK